MDRRRREARRAQDADLLAAFDHRAERDDAQPGDADDEAERHEGLEHAGEGVVLVLGGIEQGLDALGFDAVDGEG